MSGREVFWCGAAPDVCQLCDQPITDTFIDGRTMWGPWACMCKECWEEKGDGLGTGRGQMYGRQPDGRFLKIEYAGPFAHIFNDDLDPAERSELRRFDAERDIPESWMI